MVAPTEYGMPIVSSVSITNVLSVTDSTSGLSCSFQGGCSYTVTSDGLTSTLADSEVDYIDVCGNPCAISVAESDASQLTCVLPYLSTAYSAENFKIVTEGALSGTWSGTGSSAELAKLADGNNKNDFGANTSTNCYF